MSRSDERVNYRGCRVIEVIECVTLEGEGVEGSPLREVRTYTDLNGNILARVDPVALPDTVELTLNGKL